MNHATRAPDGDGVLGRIPTCAAASGTDPPGGNEGEVSADPDPSGPRASGLISRRSVDTMSR
jgi:hypothetical protein